MNPHRGDVSIYLKTGDGGRDFTLRPSFSAIIEIEQATGLGIVSVASRLIQRDIGLGHLAAIVTAGLKASGEPADTQTVAQMVYKTGILDEKLLASINDFITAALSGGEKSDLKKNDAESQ